MARSNKPQAEVDELQRRLGGLKDETTQLAENVVGNARSAASAAAEIAQEQGGRLAEIARRRPIAVLAIGMVMAFALGRWVSSLGR